MHDTYRSSVDDSAARMTLYDFIIEQNKLVCRFADFWHNNCKKDLQNFPMTMEPEEWAEQLALFEQTEDLTCSNSLPEQ